MTDLPKGAEYAPQESDIGLIGDPGVILVADDDPKVAKLIERVLCLDHHSIRTVSNGSAALEIVRREAPDLVLIDVLMPGLSGIEVCRRLKSDRATCRVPIVIMTGLPEPAVRLEGYAAGADDFLTKPVATRELRLRVQALINVKRNTDGFESAESLLLGLAEIIEARDVSTAGHCERLSHYAVELGRRLGLNFDDLDTLRLGGFLHDIGKIGVADAVLMKPGPLTAAETTLMRQHTLIGDRLCAGLRSLAKVRPIVRHHHERQDGSGYPDGLHGAEIPLIAQIVGVADVFDALTTKRPYRDAVDVWTACAVLRQEAQQGLHCTALVETFCRMVQVEGLLPNRIGMGRCSDPTAARPSWRANGGRSRSHRRGACASASRCSGPSRARERVSS
jgi:putative two-component system response regulator